MNLTSEALKGKIRVGSQFPQPIKESLVAFLRRNEDNSPGATKICQGLTSRYWFID
jgi:hypothetical protein